MPSAHHAVALNLDEIGLTVDAIMDSLTNFGCTDDALMHECVRDIAPLKRINHDDRPCLD